MEANNLLDLIGNVNDNIIEETKSKKRKIIPKWTKLIAVAAGICVVAYSSINTLLQFDYFKTGCSTIPGTIVGDDYYYNVLHSGVWKYSSGDTEKVLSAYLEDGWLVNESGLYYKYGKELFRMDLQTFSKQKLYSANDGTHIDFNLLDNGNIIVTVYNNAQDAYQILINGLTGELIEQLTENISLGDNEQLYTNLHYNAGKRQIDLVSLDESANEKYMPFENGKPLLPEGKWVGSYCFKVCDDVLNFDVYNDIDADDKCETLMIFADGYTVIEPQDFRYSGAIGHTLLYVDSESPENYGNNGFGIWCFDVDSGDRWQLKGDTECDFYAFTNDEFMLYSCVPWNKGHTAWQIIYEDNRPISLQQIDKITK